MSVLYSFFPNTYVPSAGNGTPNCVVGQTFKPGYNGNLNGLLFYKQASDTGPHTALVYLESSTATLVSQAFTGETASGWQTCTFTTPLAVTANTNYRVCVSRNVQPWAYAAGYSGVPGGPSPIVYGSVMTMSGGYYGLSSQTAYPANSSGDYYGVDVIFDGPAVNPAVVVSQALTEAWRAAGAVGVSQALAETWVTRTPPTADVVSQALAETWVSKNAPAEQLIVSQALVEIWTAKVQAQPLRVSSQVI